MAGRGEGTGVFLRLDEESCSSVRVVVPESFRFGDTNPVNGLPYAESWYRDLPGYAAVVVRDHLDLEPGSWNVLVEDREVPEWVDLDTVFSTGVVVAVPEQRKAERARGDHRGFRLSAVNPINGRQYRHSPSSELPGWVVDLLWDMWGVLPVDWDAMRAAGELG